MKILIGISLSSKNFKFINKLLESLNRLEIPNNYDTEFVFVIEKKNLVYSNIVNKKLYKKKIKILLSSFQGIPQSRNIFLKYTRVKNSKYIGFIDDDCIIPRKWLKNMVKFIKEKKIDIVGGPQLHLVKNQFYSKLFKLIEPNRKHNEKVSWVATNNSFFKTLVLKKNNTIFDDQMKNIGGSDQLFFKSLNKASLRCKWNRKSYVVENIQTDRENILWFLKRNFRYGYSGNYIDKKIYGPVFGNFLNYSKFAYLFIFSIIFFFLIFKKQNYYKSIFFLCRSVGRFMGSINYKPKKYI